MTHSVTVRHNFETAHRLPHLQGKCQSLHGHSWWAEVTVEAPVLAAGLVVEFGPFKAKLRAWIDDYLDHGVMLGTEDPLLPILKVHNTKVHEVVDGWPTVETVALMIANVAETCLLDLVRAPGAHVTRVDVHETHVNMASWVSA